MDCPLCHSLVENIWGEVAQRKYYRCAHCDLIYLDKSHYLSREEEKGIYDFHENNPLDINYREFLSRLASPLNKRLKVNSQGLDFGSGPGPTLSLILEELGHKMDIFDKIYCFNESVFKRKYDFVTSTEVFEHLKRPADILKRLKAALLNDGILAIMTKRSDHIKTFENFRLWYYKNDPTHICFYSLKTFTWIAETYQFKIDFKDKDLIFLKA